ncbi:hypothetical protein V9K67_13815 [Paraflavisolibacter sp. H34]|uniref:HD domain-containing protein n=1 Tax=Huijunlia imazamoxiresistens TaxID=3127457 RepID=UPI0030169DC5
MSSHYLYEKWKGLTRQAPPEKAERCWQRLQAAYSEPHRRYHNLEHLNRMFRWFDAYVERLRQPQAVQWAIFYHDAVYRPGEPDNEEQSARLAEAVLRELELDEVLISPVRALILATRDHYAGGERSGDGAYFLDFDLGILAVDQQEYAAYVQAVRQEYEAVPDEAFRAGRTAFVHRLLQQPHLFFTPEFRAKEEQARANLTFELQECLWHS